MELMNEPNELSNLEQFLVEVVENLRYGISENVSADNIALEINASKFKFNIEIPDLCSILMKALLEITITDENAGNKEIISQFLKLLNCLKDLLVKYLNTEEYQFYATIAL